MIWFDRLVQIYCSCIQSFSICASIHLLQISLNFTSGYKTRAGANRAVFEGRKMKTVGGLKKDNLVKNKNGKIVSKKASAKGKQNKWIKAVAKARASLKIKGFSPVGGKTAAGQKLLKLAKSFYKK